MKTILRIFFVLVCLLIKMKYNFLIKKKIKHDTKIACFYPNYLVLFLFLIFELIFHKLIYMYNIIQKIYTFLSLKTSSCCSSSSCDFEEDLGLFLFTMVLCLSCKPDLRWSNTPMSCLGVTDGALL